MPQKDLLRRLPITSAIGVGNTTIVAGGQLSAGIGSIRVYQLELESTAAETLSPFSNTTSIPGQIKFTAGETLVLPNTGQPWMEALPGQNLVWNLLVGGTLTGSIWYSIA